VPYEPILRSRLRRMLSVDEDIEDVLWTTYERIYANDSWQTAEKPIALIYQVARNIAIDQIRRRKVVAFEGASKAFYDAADSEPEPEERMDSKRALQVTLEAIEALPTQCRTIFKMRRLDQLRPQEISVKTGLSISTIEKHVARGLKLCADRLAHVGLERVPGLSWKRTKKVVRQ
jgi:RNA polymerase sigma factor (sigma-70 family)